MVGEEHALQRLFEGLHVIVEFLYILLEGSGLQQHQTVLAFKHIALIAQDIVGLIGVELNAAEIVDRYFTLGEFHSGGGGCLICTGFCYCSGGGKCHCRNK